MDNFEKALEEIRKEYEVRRMTSTYAQIELDEFFDWHNYIFIGILYLKDSLTGIASAYNGHKLRITEGDFQVLNTTVMMNLQRIEMSHM